MILHDIKQDGNRYCGPAALSAIAGIWTSEAARLLREITGEHRIIGTSDEAILAAVERLGYSWRFSGFPSGETLGQWLNASVRDPESIYLISAGNHWQCVWRDRYVCGKTILPISFNNSFCPRKAKLQAVYEVKEVTA